jgi:toluene monooxygenase system ferredoxin subunit
MQFFSVLDENYLANGEKIHLKVNQHSVLLLKHQGQYYAYKNQCAHLKFPLTDADLIDDVLVCNLHGWQYNIKSGHGINPAGVSLFAYPVKVKDGKIHIGVLN